MLMCAWQNESPKTIPPTVGIPAMAGREETPLTDAGPDSSQMEIFSSWALFIMIMLLIAALFTSYMLQQKKVEAVHETVISIFAGRQQTPPSWIPRSRLTF